MTVRQPGLKATAPDAPLSAVLSAVNKSSLKADTAYRRGEDLRRDLLQLGDRLESMQQRTEGLPTEAAICGLRSEVADLNKWRAKASQRLDAVVQFANEALEAVKEVKKAQEGLSYHLGISVCNSLSEVRDVAAELKDLRRKVTLLRGAP